MIKRARFESAVWAIVIVASAALIGAAGLNPAALAQQAQTASIAADDLFWPDTPDFKSGAGAVARLVNIVRQAQTPGSQCPTDVDFTVFDSTSDSLWSQALANVRREAIEGVLRGFGSSVRVTAKSTNGIISAVIISAQTAKDKEKPKLDTNSVPRKGTKVKAGDQIKVTMIARDHANLWQSGIKTIQLVVESDGGRFVASENYPPAPPGCTALPPERRVEATYTVPSNPPPIVRLAALAEDHAGHMDTDVGEFPTGDWYGTFDWTYDCDGPPGFGIKGRGVGDLALDYDGNGNLTGTLAGTTPEGLSRAPTCTHTGLAPGGTFSAKLVGSYTPGPGTMFARAVDVQITPGRQRVSCPTGTGEGAAPVYPGYETPMLPNAFRDLRRAPDGSLKSKGEQTVGYGNGSCTVNYSLTLRQAQN